MALVHGTDLLFAAARRTQHRRPASDRAGLPRHRGSHHRDHRPPPLPGTHAGHTCIEHIPWGVPDALLATPPLSPTAHLRAVAASVRRTADPEKKGSTPAPKP
ncbi:hypothetical protein ACFSTC_60265 [Nonomuraea ferruginea]